MKWYVKVELDTETGKLDIVHEPPDEISAYGLLTAAQFAIHDNVHKSVAGALARGTLKGFGRLDVEHKGPKKEN